MPDWGIWAYLVSLGAELPDECRTYSIEAGLRQASPFYPVDTSETGNYIVREDSWSYKVCGVSIANIDSEFLLNGKNKFDTIEAHNLTPNV